MYPSDYTTISFPLLGLELNPGRSFDIGPLTINFYGLIIGIGLLLAVFSTILGHSVFSWCLRYFSPAFVSASKLCEPVVAAVLAAILFAELPSLLQILGAALILGGVLYYAKLERSHS